MNGTESISGNGFVKLIFGFFRKTKNNSGRERAPTPLSYICSGPRRPIGGACRSAAPELLTDPPAPIIQYMYETDIDRRPASKLRNYGYSRQNVLIL